MDTNDTQKILGAISALSDELATVTTELTAVKTEFSTSKTQVTEHIAALSEDLAEFKVEVRGRFDRMDDRFVSLEDNVEGINRSLDTLLEGDTLGKEHITLTRPEYDTMVDSLNLPNRFHEQSQAAH